MFLSLEFTVDICEQENKMALYFSYENQIYLPKVDGGTLRVNINICTVHTLTAHTHTHTRTWPRTFPPSVPTANFCNIQQMKRNNGNECEKLTLLYVH